MSQIFGMGGVLPPPPAFRVRGAHALSTSLPCVQALMEGSDGLTHSNALLIIVTWLKAGFMSILRDGLS